jgi:anti-repressor protein
MTDSRNGLSVFNFEGKSVRVVEHRGEPWWVAKDVCDVLGVTNPTEALRRLDDDEKFALSYTEGKNLGFSHATAGVNIINESALYALIMRGKKTEARRFRKWVTSSVLPSIRRHGGYLTDEKIEEALTDPDTIIRLAQTLKAEREKRLALEAKAGEDRPRVLFAQSVEASDCSILIGDLAKLIRQNGVRVGPKRLFEWMRENGYLMKNGDSRNMPTQRAMEAGLFKIRERAIDNPDGSIFLARTTKVTGRGQVFFMNLFLSGKSAEASAGKSGGE